MIEKAVRNKYKDETWLREQYWEKEKSMAEIGQVIGLSAMTISRWLKELGVPARRSRIGSGRKSLNAQDYQRMAERDGAVWVGEEAPISNDEPTIWRCKKCGHQWETTYRKLHLRNDRRKKGVDLGVLCVQCRHTKVCAWCGNEFIANYQQEKYCCPDCKGKGHRKLLGLQQLLPGQPGDGYSSGICEMCGKTFFFRRDKERGRFCSLACAGRGQRGENSPGWRGGVSFEPYGLDFNEQLKRAVRERDNFTCQLCGITQEQNGIALAVHHIDYDKTNNHMENLLSLCRPCHGRTNANREYWKALFINQMREKHKAPKKIFASFQRRLFNLT